MSGCHFEYAQCKIADIYYSIEEYLNGREIDEDDIDWYIKEHYLSEEEISYIREHHRTIPNQYEFSEETLAEFKNAVHILKQAEIYAQRIDWLLSGDDGEDSFHERLKEELEKLENDETTTSEEDTRMEQG